MTRNPQLVSLFAGIGGFDLAFQRAGFEIVAHVEIDVNCRKLLASKFPKAQTFSDVRECGAHNMPACDVLTFGFPCQDLSVAGKRAGLDGKRSGLFYEATRIAYELKPTYLIWENVPGLLSSDNGRDMLRVVRELQRSGYCGCWRVLDAQYFGLAQRRRRIFGVFAREHLRAECCSEILSIREGVRGHPAPRRETRQEVAGTLGGGAGQRGWSNDRDRSGAFPVCIKGAAIGRKPEAGPQFGEILDDGTTYTLNCTEQHAVCSTVSAKWSKGTGGLAGNECGNLIVFPQNLSTTQHAAAVNLSPNLQAKNPMAVTYSLELSNQGAGGNRGFGEAHEPVRTLNLAGPPGVVTHASKELIGSCVRRLTPRECERLQGFPDDWTAGFSDSTRYKMIGNAVAVPVVGWIANRLRKPLTT